MNLVEDVDVQCPFCGESFALTVDTTQGNHSTVEDCVVCCRPISWQIECEPGEVLAVTAGR